MPSDGLVKIGYDYDNNYTEHSFLVGERDNKDGIDYTEYSNLEDWSQRSQPQPGEWLRVYGKFESSKLNVTAYSPYEEIRVALISRLKTMDILRSQLLFGFTLR